MILFLLLLRFCVVMKNIVLICPAAIFRCLSVVGNKSVQLLSKFCSPVSGFLHCASQTSAAYIRASTLSTHYNSISILPTNFLWHLVKHPPVTPLPRVQNYFPPLRRFICAGSEFAWRCGKSNCIENTERIAAIFLDAPV